MPVATAILERAAKGEPEAAQIVVSAHGGMVFGMCRRLAADPEDCYQEVWEKVLRALPRFDPAGPAPLAGWIATITRRHLIDRHRRRKVRGEVVALDALRGPEDAPDVRVGKSQMLQRLEAALVHLPVDQRHVVVQHHIHDVPLADLAAEAGVALGTIKSRLHRGRARLAEHLRSAP